MERSLLVPASPPQLDPRRQQQQPGDRQPASRAPPLAVPGNGSSSSGSSVLDLSGEKEEEEDAEPADPASAAAAASQPCSDGPQQERQRRRLSLALHIAYHPSYQVPVLYFEVSRAACWR